MRVQITNPRCYSFLKDVNLDLIFNAVNEGDVVTIKAEQLVAAGATEQILLDCEWHFPIGDVKVIGTQPDATHHFATGEKDVLNSEASERRYCISERCCNQFGERDEIQTIINSLQADVVARGNRITELERALRTTNDELHKAIKEVNHHLEHNICSSDLDDPDYWDFQTVHDNAILLGDAND